jgi:Ca2+-binding EF-hand superfamily protein
VDASTIDNLFKHIASDEDIIDKASFKGAMAKAGVTLFDDDRIVSAFWDALDVNHDGSTNKKELMVGMMTLASGTPEQKLRLSFAIFGAYPLDAPRSPQPNVVCHRF